MSDVEQVDDLQVLAGLRHDAFVRGYDQEHHIDPVRAREHVTDEARVPWNVHDADLAPSREPHVGKTEIDRHAAPFFLSQPVRVDPRQRGHER